MAEADVERYQSSGCHAYHSEIHSMRVQITGFEWDEGNEEHIGCHSVDPEEAEEVLRGTHLHQHGPFDRHLAWGRTAVGRFLLVIFKLKASGIARVVTARDMSAREKHRFRRRLKS